MLINCYALRFNLTRFLNLYVVGSLTDRKSNVLISGLHKTRNRENREAGQPISTCRMKSVI